MEHMLRKELESCRIELVSLQHEHGILLNRLKVAGDGSGFSLLKLDQELHARVDCLQNQGLLWLDENGFICSKLLEFIRSRGCQNSNSSILGHGEPLQEAAGEFDDYSTIEFDMKVQSFRRGSENFRRSLQMISEILHDRPTLESCETQSRSMDIGGMDQTKYWISERLPQLLEGSGAEEGMAMLMGLVRMRGFQTILRRFMWRAAALLWLLTGETRLSGKFSSISMTVPMSMEVVFLCSGTRETRSSGDKAFGLWRSHV